MRRRRSLALAVVLAAISARTRADTPEARHDQRAPPPAAPPVQPYEGWGADFDDAPPLRPAPARPTTPPAAPPRPGAPGPEPPPGTGPPAWAPIPIAPRELVDPPQQKRPGSTAVAATGAAVAGTLAMAAALGLSIAVASEAPKVTGVGVLSSPALSAAAVCSVGNAIADTTGGCGAATAGAYLGVLLALPGVIAACSSPESDTCLYGSLASVVLAPALSATLGWGLGRRPKNGLVFLSDHRPLATSGVTAPHARLAPPEPTLTGAPSRPGWRLRLPLFAFSF